MNRKGFSFIETIITIVILSTSLLYLYNTYSSIISNEETRLYYDDPSYIYKTNYVGLFLRQNTNINSIKNYAFKDAYLVTVGTGFTSMFTEQQLANGASSSLEAITNTFHINQILLVKSEYFEECNGNDSDSDICKNSWENLNYNLKSYLNTLNSDDDYEYYLVVVYSEKVDASGNVVSCVQGIDANCITYYAFLGI